MLLNYTSRRPTYVNQKWRVLWLKSLHRNSSNSKFTLDIQKNKIYTCKNTCIKGLHLLSNNTCVNTKPVSCGVSFVPLQFVSFYLNSLNSEFTLDKEGNAKRVFFEITLCIPSPVRLQGDFWNSKLIHAKEEHRDKCQTCVLHGAHSVPLPSNSKWH